MLLKECTSWNFRRMVGSRRWSWSGCPGEAPPKAVPWPPSHAHSGVYTHPVTHSPERHVFSFSFLLLTTKCEHLSSSHLNFCDTQCVRPQGVLMLWALRSPKISFRSSRERCTLWAQRWVIGLLCEVSGCPLSHHAPLHPATWEQLWGLCCGGDFPPSSRTPPCRFSSSSHPRTLLPS